MKILNSYFLITGSNRGIGRAVALEAARRGAHLILANRTADAGLRDELMAAGAKSVEQVSLDLSSKDAIAGFLKQFGSKQVDILFNNAGQLTGGLIEQQPIDEIYSMFQVNVNALVHLTHGFIPEMVGRKHGKIVNHCSVSGVMNFPCASTYSASKSAVLAFTNCVRQELKGTGVTTLTLITAGVETKMYGDIEKKYGSNLDVSFLRSIPPDVYAGQICDAIEDDRVELLPGGASRIGLFIARHFPRLFESLAGLKFRR